jgi:hypothetical protein
MLGKMLAPRYRRSGAKKPAAVVRVVEADAAAEDRGDEESPRLVSGSAKAEAMGRGAGPVADSHVVWILAVFLAFVGTVCAVTLLAPSAVRGARG